jgi:hypothetical protein
MLTAEIVASCLCVVIVERILHASMIEFSLLVTSHSRGDYAWGSLCIWFGRNG